MADYDQPDYVTRRPRYFNNQYLSEQDFIDEQKYHLDRQRRHDRLLHVSGIAEGLDVTSNGAVVTVTAGTAVDAKGRHLLLDTPQTLTLTRDHQGSRVVYLRYQEVPSNEVVGDQGVAGYTRFTETAQLLQEAPGGDAADGRLVLAELTVAADGTVTAVKKDSRKYSGLRLAGPAGKTLTLRASNDGTRAVLDTGLSLAEPLAVGTVSAARAQLEVKTGAGRTPLRVTDADGKDLLTLGNDSSLALGASDKVGKLSLAALRSFIELGAGVAGKETHAGKLGYQLFTDGLDIVGAGTSEASRKLTVHAAGGTTFTGDVRLPDKMLWLRSAESHGLGWYGGSTAFGSFSPDGPVLFGWAGGGLGTTRTTKRVALSWDDQGRVIISGQLELGTSNPVILKSNAISLNNNPLYVAGATDTNHGLAFNGGRTNIWGFSPDGPVLFGYSGGGLAATGGSKRVALAWSHDGSVKIDQGGTPSLFVTGLPERVRIIRGSVHGNGNINVGTGFRITKPASTIGLYDIIFDQPFNTVPTVVATQQWTGENEAGGSTRDNAVVVFNKVGSVRIKTGDGDGKADNRFFHFIVIGT